MLFSLKKKRGGAILHGALGLRFGNLNPSKNARKRQLIRIV